MSEPPKAFAFWKLTQKRYKDGLFIVSQIMDGDKVVALDARYYLEKEAGFIPTRQGFRVYSDMFDGLIALLRCNPQDVNLAVLRKVKHRTLLCSYCDDKYGKGIDFRYHKHTSEFEGRERRGIRLALSDFDRLRSSLTDNETWRTKLEGAPDLFSTKPLLPPVEKTRPAKAKKQLNGGAFVDPGLADLIESL